MRLLSQIALFFFCAAAFCRAGAQTIDNRDVFMLASVVADDVELIREFMGRPYDDSPRLPASEVSDFELYFQAQTLFRKANQLAQDFGVASREAPPPAPESDIGAADVHGVVEAAAGQITAVKEELGIESQLPPQRRQAGISSTGVFMTIVDVNRQLNLLLAEPIRASDVYNQVRLAVSYAGGILEDLSSGTASPSLPPFDGYKTPADVYAELLACLDVVSRIAARVGVPVMSLASRRNIPDDIDPGHVYDIATIVVADLANLVIELDANGIAIDLPEPERIMPTHAHDLTVLLRRQLDLIDAAL